MAPLSSRPCATRARPDPARHLVGRRRLNLNDAERDPIDHTQGSSSYPAAGVPRRLEQADRRQEQQPVDRQRPQRGAHSVRPAPKSKRPLLNVEGICRYQSHHQGAPRHTQVSRSTAQRPSCRGSWAVLIEGSPPLRRRCETATVAEPTSSRALRAGCPFCWSPRSDSMPTTARSSASNS